MAEEIVSAKTMNSHPRIEVVKFNGKNNFGMWRCEVMDALNASNLETNPLCLRLLFLSLPYLFISCMLLLCLLYMLDIHCVLYCYMLGDCLLTLVFNQESQRGTSTLI